MDRVRIASLVFMVFAFLGSALVVYAALRAPYPLVVTLGSPTAYLNLYIHVPMAWSTYLLYTGAFIAAILYLVKGWERLDNYIRGFILVGTVYALFTLVSGMAWASESWGSAWSWDPRETGVLLLLLAYAVYYPLRASIPDPDSARRVSAAYAIAAYSMVPVSYLAPRLTESSLHPTMQHFGPFMRRPEVMSLFGMGVIVASIIAVTLAYLAAKSYEGVRLPGFLRLVGIGLVVAGVASGLALAAPYLQGGVERVVGAVVEDGEVVALNLSSGAVVELAKPIRVPAEVGERAVVGHLVVTEPGGTVRIVTHWSVAFNLAAYMSVLGVTVLVISWQATRRKRGQEH